MRLPVLNQEDGGAATVNRGARWAGAVTFVSHGAVIGVRSTDTEMLARISKALPTGAQLSDDKEADAVYSWRVEHSHYRRPVHVITMKCRRDARGRDVARTTDVEKALALLNHDAEFRVAMYAPSDVFVHAAAVSWHGGIVLLPGHSFAGKSTLAAELVRQGAPYYSDEYAVVNAAGMVCPFPRRLMLRSDGGVSRGRFSPEELGGTLGAGALPVSCVVATRYVPGARWTPQPMSRGEAVFALLGHAIDVQARPTHVLDRIVSAIGPQTIGLRGDRGEVTVTARLILDYLAGLAGHALPVSRSA